MAGGEFHLVEVLEVHDLFLEYFGFVGGVLAEDDVGDEGVLLEVDAGFVFEVVGGVEGLGFWGGRFVEGVEFSLAGVMMGLLLSPCVASNFIEHLDVLPPDFRLVLLQRHPSFTDPVICRVQHEQVLLIVHQ